LSCLVLEPPLLSITSGSNWLYVEWNAQPATFRVQYRESGAPDYQVIVPTTSQLSHNISALQPNTLYNIVVEATHTVTQLKVNSSVTEAHTTPRGELKRTAHCTVCTYGICVPLCNYHSEGCSRGWPPRLGHSVIVILCSCEVATHYISSACGYMFDIFYLCHTDTCTASLYVSFLFAEPA